MHASVKPYIEKIEKFFQQKKEKVELLIVGGLAMSFYELPRFTVDIDAQISCSDETYFEFLEYLKKEKIAFNISENINSWGIIPLPQGFKKRAKVVYKSKYFTLKALEPRDFIFSKLLRGTEEDFKDILAVVKKYKIIKKELEERERLIDFPKDPETLFFKKKFSYLMGLLKNKIN